MPSGMPDASSITGIPCRAGGSSPRSRSLIDGDKLDADGLGHFQHLAEWHQPAGLRVDAEHNNVVRLFVGRQKQRTAWSNLKTAGTLSLRGNVFDGCQRSFGSVDGEDRNVVGPTVRSIK